MCHANFRTNLLQDHFSHSLEQKDRTQTPTHTTTQNHTELLYTQSNSPAVNFVAVSFKRL